MKWSRVKLAEEIAHRLESGQPANQIAREVAALLIDSGRTSELNSLLRDVQELRARQNGIVEVTAASAHPLTTEQRSEIQQATRGQYPNAKEIIIHHEQNPNVVGGLSLSFANADLDMTIRAKLNQLRTLTA
jgi:F0F1-type ATP synthase delta subunit